MSLRLWLPLTNTVENLGLENCEFTTNNITSVDGKINQYAAHFNGNNSWISIKNPPDLNITDFSFAFWLKTYADTDGMCIYNGRTKAGNPIAIFIINGSIRFDDGALHSNLLTIEKNKWYHIVITRDSNNIKTYLNGNLCETTSSTSFALNKITYASIGCSSLNSNAPSAYPLDGDLNDFRIYDHCLSDKEVKELSKGLILHYKLSKSLNSNLITTDFVTTATKSSYYRSHSTINHLLTPEIIMANQGRTLWFSYDIYTPGTRKNGNDTSNNFSRFGIHGLLKYNNGTENKTSYPFSKSLNYSGNLIRVEKSYVIPSNIVSVTSFTFSIQCGTYNFNSPADDNDETWYIKNLKLEWDTPTPYSPHTEYDNDDIEYDYSGYGNHAIANSDIKSNSDSYLYNSCREFNGDKQWFTIQNPLRKIFNDDFTVSVCVNISAEHRGIILGDNPNHTIISFEIYLGRVFRFYYDNKPNLIGNIAIPINTWHNIIFIRDNNTFKIYVDGVLDNSITPDYSLPASDITALSRIGDDYRGDTINAVSFPGKMSDLRIYGTALSEDDIKELYNVPTSLDNNGNIFTGELIEED